MERLLNNFSKITDLLWSEDLYEPTINHFLNRRYISRKSVPLSSLREFSLFHRNAFNEIHALASSKAISVMSKHPIPNQTELNIWKGAVDFRH